MSTPPTEIPAGWYTDPHTPHYYRYWDGSAWTDHISSVHGEQLPSDLIAAERRAARRARAVMLAFVPAMLTSWVVGIFYYHEFFANFSFNVNSQHRVVTPFGGNHFALGIGMQAASLAATGTLVLMLMWLYRATQLAEAAGIPTPRGPGATVAGWFIPIVNFWWPYQSMRDLVPGSASHKTLTKRWWVCWLGETSFTIVALVLAAAVSVPAGGAVLIPAAALAVGFVMSTRLLISGVLRAHEEVLSERRLVAGDAP